MSLGTLLLLLILIFLILILIGVTPNWSHSKRWGYGPGGVVGLFLIVLIVMLLNSVFDEVV